MFFYVRFQTQVRNCLAELQLASFQYRASVVDSTGETTSQMSCEDDSQSKAGTPSTPQEEKHLSLLTPPSSSTPEDLPTPLPPQDDTPPKSTNRTKDATSPTKKKPAPPPPAVGKENGPSKEVEIFNKENKEHSRDKEELSKPVFKKPAPKPPPAGGSNVAAGHVAAATDDRFPEEKHVVVDTIERRLRGEWEFALEWGRGDGRSRSLKTRGSASRRQTTY